MYSCSFPSRLRRRALKFGKDPPFEILSTLNRLAAIAPAGFVSDIRKDTVRQK